MSFEISLAPMIDVTTANFRKLVRLSSQSVVLFTEMIVSSTIVHISKDRLIERLGEVDDKTVVQVGGSDPEEISKVIRILADIGWTSFNLNVGCPSSRVQKGQFGAVLMKDVDLVCRIINQVYKDTGFILSLKIRTGVDEFDSFEFFKAFVSHVTSTTPTTVFYVHARKCWLKGLSPKQNRTIPPLNYEYVYKIKEEMPNITFILNGGISSIEDVQRHQQLDGVMIGRKAVDDVFIFYSIGKALKIDNYLLESREDTRLNSDLDTGCDIFYKKHIVYTYLLSFGGSTIVCHKIAFPFLNLMHGRKGCKSFKIKLADLLKERKTVLEFIGEIHNFIS